MAVVESAVSFLVERLGYLLAQEVSHLSGVRGQVEWVETELLRMRSFLIDADRSSSSIEESERMKNLRRELRDLVNSAEDAIDMFILSVETLRREEDSCLGQLKRYIFIHKEFLARHKVASEIADIKLKLSSISDSRTTYGIEFIGQGADAIGRVGRRIFQEHSLSSSSIPAETDFVRFENEMALHADRQIEPHKLPILDRDKGTRSSSAGQIFQETDHFVDFEEKLQKFIPRLTSEVPQRLCIFSVVGMGGLGKTTFATKVYNDSRVKEHFEERGWVSVSQQYSVTDIYTALLGCFKKSQGASRDDMDQSQNASMEDMGQVISQHLKEKRYLIVLDDVWTTEGWTAFRNAFPDAANGSRVLLTTRFQEVAFRADPGIRPHKLPLLTEEESWELFCKKTFPEHKNCCPPDFEEVGRQIVGKCFGLPLAIVAVGGMLAGKSKTEWEHVLRSISSQLGDKAEPIISRILELSSSSSGQMLQEHKLQETDNFVGFENEMAKFIKELINKKTERRRTFFLVGMGGLGKTTFATRVYHDSRVKEHFQERAWVSVSRQYAVTDIYTTLLSRFKELSEQERQNAKTVSQMVDKISTYLKDKKYLIVLDDVWKKEDWNNLQNAFPEARNGSRILLTTRNMDVASHADPQGWLYPLPFLGTKQSWDLFRKKTFPGREHNYPSDFEDVGRRILQKCHGLPLAIVAIGGLLAGKSITEWEHAAKSISWQFGDQGEANISGILKLSYKELPYDLKPCFLYLGIFPEDEEFRAKQLIHMWAAEGLLQQRGDETVEEVGEDCLRALVRRSMIQVAETSSTGGIKSCRIHDLLRDIAISEAKGDKFLQVQRRSTNIALSSSAKSRRLAIHCKSDSINECISSNSAVSHLRSMFIYAQDSAVLEEKRPKSLYSRYKLLRVLYLHNVGINSLPSEIGDLIHLRYFGCVGRNSLCSLPRSIGNPGSVQTLRICSSESIEIPPAIQKMKELRHLQVARSLRNLGSKLEKTVAIFNGKPQLEQMSNLQTLTHVKAGEWVENSLEELKRSLRKLGITLDSGTYCQYIAKLEYLQSLSLASPQFGEEIPNLKPLTHLLQLRKLSLWGKLEKLPEPLEFPPNLAKLTISYSRLDKDAVATLEELKNLRILRLLEDSYMGEEMNCSEEGFPCLEYLRLEGLPNLENWTIEKGAMRKLAHLRITDCKKLKMPPKGVEHLRAIKKLEGMVYA